MEVLLAHNPARIDRDAAIARSLTLGIGQVCHGMPPWAVERGLTYGPDGYLVLVTCGVPEHAARREVLATFKGAAIRKASIEMVSDHPPDPPTRAEVDRGILQGIVNNPAATLADVKTAIRILAEGQP